MHGFEHRVLLAEIRAADDSETTHQAGAEIGDDVAVEVFEQQDVELLGFDHQVHAQRVDDAVVGLDVRIVGRDLAEAVQEQAVRELHDVGLVHRGDALATHLARVLEGELRHPERGLGGDDLETLDDARHDGVLEAGVEIFGVLAHHDEVDALEPARNARQRARRTEVGVELELLAELDVDRLEALPHGCRDRSLEGDLGAADRVEHGVGQRLAAERHRFGAGEVAVPVELRAGGFEDAHGRRGDLGADAVAREQGDGTHGSHVGNGSRCRIDRSEVVRRGRPLRA